MREPDSPKQKPPLPHAMRDRKPWPMWPIMISIVLFIAVYTYINLEFRKEGQAYEPFQAMMERKMAIIEKNMYDWYGIAVKQAEDQSPIPAPVASIEQEMQADPLETVLPDQLKFSIATKPILVPGPLQLESPPAISSGEPLRLRLWLPSDLVGDERFQLLAFYKEGQLYLLATLFADSIDAVAPALDGDLRPVALAIPTDPIASEIVDVTFLSGGHVARWSLQTASAP